MLRVSLVVVVVVVVVGMTEAGRVGAGPPSPPEPSCRYWCIKETARRERYCCDPGNGETHDYQRKSLY